MQPAELRALRLRLGWIQSVAADRLGVSFRSYRYTEEGIKSNGQPLLEIPASIAVTMLAFELVTEVAAVGVVSPYLLAEFRRAVMHEGRLLPTPPSTGATDVKPKGPARPKRPAAKKRKRRKPRRAAAAH